MRLQVLQVSQAPTAIALEVQCPLCDGLYEATAILKHTTVFFYSSSPRICHSHCSTVRPTAFTSTATYLAACRTAPPTSAPCLLLLPLPPCCCCCLGLAPSRAKLSCPATRQAESALWKGASPPADPGRTVRTPAQKHTLSRFLHKSVAGFRNALG